MKKFFYLYYLKENASISIHLKSFCPLNDSLSNVSHFSLHPLNNS